MTQSRKDFYRLFAFFNGIDEAGLGPNNGNSPQAIPVPKNWPNLSGDEAKFVEPEPMKIRSCKPPCKAATRFARDRDGDARTGQKAAPTFVSTVASTINRTSRSSFTRPL